MLCMNREGLCKWPRAREIQGAGSPSRARPPPFELEGDKRMCLKQVQGAAPWQTVEGL